MSSTKPLPAFHQKNVADQAQADSDASIAPVDKDRKIFAIAGQLLWGDFDIFAAGVELDKLVLGPLRRGPVSTFFSALEESNADAGGLNSNSDCWTQIPSSATSIGDALWDAFRKNPTKATHDQLVKNGPPGTDAPDLGKRARKAPSRYSDYETDTEGRQTKGNKRTVSDSHRAPSSLESSNSRARQARQPRVTAPSRSASQPLITTAFGVGNARGRRVLPDDDEDDNMSSAGASQSAGPSQAAQTKTCAKVPEKPVKKTMSSGAGKAKTTKAKNKLLPKKRMRRLNKSERRQLTNASRGRPDDSDTDMSSEDEENGNGEDEDEEMDDGSQTGADGGDDPQVVSSKPHAHDPKRPPFEQDKTCTRYFEFVDASEVVRVRKNSGTLFTDIDERWRCRLCDGVYTAHPGSRSNLALHVNQVSNPAFCSRLFDPIDKRLEGCFTPLHPQNDKDDPGFGGSPVISSGGSSADSTPSLRGRQQNLDGWFVSQKAEVIKLKIEEVRRLVLNWVIVDNQPFTEPTRPAFQAIVRALAPALLPALTSPRTIRRDLEQAHKHIVEQAVGHLRTHSIPFSISHDSWTSPSRRYSFLAFVVSYVDVDWCHRQFLLAFRVIEGAHTGATLAGHLIHVLNEARLLHLWNGVLVGDAASSNGRMADALQYQFSGVGSSEVQAALGKVIEHRRGDHLVFCYNHALNRAMIDFYTGLGVKASAAGENVLRAGNGGDGDDADVDVDAEDISDKSDSESESDSDSGNDDDDVDDDDQGARHGAQRSRDSSASTAATQKPMHRAMVSGDRVAEAPENMEQAEGEQQPQRQVETALHSAGGDQEQGDNGQDEDPEAEAAGQLFSDLRSELSPILEEDEYDIWAEDNDGNSGDIASPIHKLARLVKQIHSSSEALREFKKYMSKEYFATRPKKIDIVPPKVSQTRWNSRQKQFKTALKIKDGLLLYAKNSRRSKVTEIGLDHTDFDILAHITDITEFTYFQTLDFERSDGHACLVLHSFGELIHAINVELENAKKLPSALGARLIGALDAMKTKVHLYQEAAVSTKSLLLATVLHPKFRLKTFQADYPDRVEQVKQLLNDEVKQLKETAAAEPEADQSQKGKAKSKSKKKAKYQRELPSTVPISVTAEQTEVDAYLAGRHPFRDADDRSEVAGDTILGWWKDHESHLPTLAKVARKYLATPGSTSEVERVFSRAGVFVSGRRPLGPTALQQLVVTSQLIKKGFLPFPVGLPAVTPVNKGANRAPKNKISQPTKKTKIRLCPLQAAAVPQVSTAQHQGSDAEEDSEEEELAASRLM